MHSLTWGWHSLHLLFSLWHLYNLKVPKETTFPISSSWMSSNTFRGHGRRKMWQAKQSLRVNRTWNASHKTMRFGLLSSWSMLRCLLLVPDSCGRGRQCHCVAICGGGPVRWRRGRVTAAIQMPSLQQYMIVQCICIAWNREDGDQIPCTPFVSAWSDSSCAQVHGTTQRMTSISFYFHWQTNIQTSDTGHAVHVHGTSGLITVPTAMEHDE